MERREGPELERLLPGALSDEDEDLLDVTRDKKLKKVQFEVDQVQEMMRDNVERIIERGDRIVELHSKSEALTDSADSFLQASKKMKHRLWWREHKFYITLVVVLIVALAIIGVRALT